MHQALLFMYNAQTMLKHLRNKRNKKAIYIMMAILIIPSFIIFGVNISQKEAKVSSTLGTIDNKKISVKDYLSSYKAVQHEMALMYGKKASESSSLINYKGEAWDRILLLDYAKQHNVKTADSEVVQWLMNQPIFQSHGQFDDKLYKLYVDNYLRLSARDFEEEIRGLLTINKVVDKLRTDVHASDEELKSLYLQENGEKDLLYGILSWESEKDSAAVTDKDIEQIYPIVKDKLTDPARVKISYLYIAKENEEAIKAIFDEKDVTLDDLSKKYSIPVKETGYFSKNEAIPEIGLIQILLSSSFSLALGQESGWLRLDQGAYKIKVLDKKAEKPLSLEEAKEELKKIMIKQKATELAVSKLNESKKKIQNNDLESFLKGSSVEARHYEKFKSGVSIPELGDTQNLGKIISELKEGEISPAFAVTNGAAIVKVLKSGTVDDKKFEAEKEEFKKKVMQDMISKQVGELLGKLRNKLKIDLDTMKKIFASDEKL